MVAKTTRPPRCQPGTAGWWGRLCTALLFAAYVFFVPIHLATETHFDDLVGAGVDAVFHHHGHAAAEHGDESDHHTPHPASDHSLTFSTPTSAPTASAVLLVALPAVTVITLEVPESFPAAPVFERTHPPGESPPDPLQPRAPPLA